MSAPGTSLGRFVGPNGRDLELTPFYPVTPLVADVDGAAFYITDLGGLGVPRAATLFVDSVNGTDSGVNGGARGTTLPYATLAAALAAAQAGDTIEIAPGSAFSLSAPMTAAAKVHINGNGATIKASAANYSGPLLVVTGAGVSLRDLVFDGYRTSGTALSISDGLLYIQSSDVAVVGCTFQNAVNIGICTRGVVPNISIERCLFSNLGAGIIGYESPDYMRISDNRFLAGWTHNTYSGAIKITASGSPWKMATGVQVRGNFIQDAGEMGIEIWGGNFDCVVSNNNIKGCTFGISMNGAVRAVVANNQVAAGTYCGIEWPDLADDSFNLDIGNSIDGAAITDPTGGAYAVGNNAATSKSHLTIIGANVRNGGIKVYRIGDVVIRSCVADGITLQYCDQVTIEGCAIHPKSDSLNAIFVEVPASGAMDGFRVLNNVFRRYNYAGNAAAWITFYSSNSAGTVTGEIVGNRADSVFCGPGYTASNGPGSTGVAIRNNLPAVPTLASLQYGFWNYSTAVFNDVNAGDGYYVVGNKVVGARGAAVADATDAASAISQLNALLARLRTHGLIAP